MINLSSFINIELSFLIFLSMEMIEKLAGFIFTH